MMKKSYRKRTRVERVSTVVCVCVVELKLAPNHTPDEGTTTQQTNTQNKTKHHRIEIGKIAINLTQCCH